MTGSMVFIGCLLACTVSSIPLDAGYGVPSARVLVEAPLPFQLLHSAPAPLPLSHHNAHPIFHSAPQPLIHSVQAHIPLAFGPVPLPLAPEPFVLPPRAIVPEPLHVAPAHHTFAPAPLPIQTPSSQFHAQDEFGQFSFGYENINSAKTETRDAFGVTRGSYQYVDANGLIQTVHYIADDINGFRVAGTNIPVAPGAPAEALPISPLVRAVVETPEVAAARAAHLLAHEEARATAVSALTNSEERKKREVDDSEPTPEPEPESKERRKREAEPIDADYLIPSAPVIVSAPVPLPLAHSAFPAPVPVPFHTLVPAPFHTPIPAPFHTLVPAPFPAPIPAPFHTPVPVPFHIPVPAPFHSPLINNIVPEPLVFAPKHIPFVPRQLPVVPEPFHFAPQPLAIAPAPLSIQAPSSQFHAQDEFGQFSFGYENINSAKTETRDAFGVTRGSYQYVDANGLIQTVHYIADDINVFRVSGTNIPVAPGSTLPIGPAPVPLIAPVPVMETAEVAAARAQHEAAHAEARAALASTE